MLKITLLAVMVLARVAASGQVYDFVSFNWQEATNRKAGSYDTIWIGSDASHNYSQPYPQPGSNAVLDASYFALGQNYCCVQQISTNSSGSVIESALSGEIQVQKQLWMTVGAPTNAVLLTSVDLGKTWTTTGTNSLTFPVSEAAQQFFRGRRPTNSFVLTITNYPKLALPPGP